MSEEMKKLSDEEIGEVTGAVMAESDKWWDADEQLSAEYHYDVDNPWIVFDDKSCKVLGRYATKKLAEKNAAKMGVMCKEIDRSKLKAGIDAYKQHGGCNHGNYKDWNNPIF